MILGHNLTALVRSLVWYGETYVKRPLVGADIICSLKLLVSFQAVKSKLWTFTL